MQVLITKLRYKLAHWLAQDLFDAHLQKIEETIQITRYAERTHLAMAHSRQVALSEAHAQVEELYAWAVSLDRVRTLNKFDPKLGLPLRREL